MQPKTVFLEGACFIFFLVFHGAIQQKDLQIRRMFLTAKVRTRKGACKVFSDQNLFMKLCRKSAEKEMNENRE